MRSDSIDTIFRVRLRHRPGELARLTAAIAEQGGLLGRMPPAYDEIRVDREMPNVLRVWRKTRSSRVGPRAR